MKRRIPQSFDDTRRPETAPEYSRRVQDMMDDDSWVGRDRVGNVFPEPAEIIEIEPMTETVLVRRKDGV